VTQVKICGVNAPDALRAAAEAGADWVGFVFFPPSPRALTPEQAAALSASYEGGPTRVGLFVDPADEDVEAVLAKVPLQVLQVHSVSAARAEALRVRFGLPVWRAVGIERGADLPTAERVDGLLLDAKAPPGADLPGGNAQPFDWSVLRGWTAPLPWLLAGGLTPENVAEAIRISGAPAVDVSSGVETARGLKDPSRIRAFITAAKTPGPV
jgi:phosphoribosylanthranilate isomerase